VVLLIQRRRHGLLPLLIGPALLLVGGAAQAQFTQYRAPGLFDPQRESREEQFERAMSEARWKLGRVLADPWLGLRNVSYLDNVGAVSEEGDVDSDLTVTLGAGLRGYLPLASELLIAAHVLPEYVWWKDLTGRRRLNGRYGLGLFGDLGRTGVEVSAQLLEESRFFSRELEEPVNTTEDRTTLALEIDIGKGLAFFGQATYQSFAFESEDDDDLPEVGILDRDERIARAGLQVALSPDLGVGLGAEHSEVEFEQVPGRQDLSNSGTSPFLNVGFDREPVLFELDVAWRSLEPEPGSSFIDFDELTGNFQAALQLLRPVELQLYAHRSLVYSLGEEYAYFLDTVTGIGLNLSLGSAAGLRIFAEEGEDDYVVSSPSALPRIDDVSSYGASLNLAVGNARITIGGRRSEYSSNLPQFDREVNQILSTVTFGRGATSPWG
jgi:hypothetical protein